MRKRVKTITEETCEYGAIAFEKWLLITLFEFAKSPAITQDDINMMITKASDISDSTKGRTLTVAEDLIEIAAGTPAAEQAVTIAYSAL